MARDNNQDGSGARHLPEGFVGKNQNEYQREIELTLEAVADGIWKWNFITDELEFSPRYYTMLGYEPDEFRADFDNWKALIHPEDQDRALSVAAEYLQTKPDTYENDFRLRTKGGEYRWIKATARVVERTEDGGAVRMIGIHQDITDQRRAEIALRESEEKYRLLHESAGIGIGYYTPDGTILSYNKVAAGHVNRRPEDLVGMSVMDLFPPDAAAEYMRRIEAACSSERPMEFEDRVELPVGSKWFLSVITKIVNEENHTLGVQIMSHDITERKRAEESNRALAEIVDSAPNTVTIHDAQGRFVYANRKTFDLHGYAPDEFFALNLHNLDVPESEERIEERIREILQKGESTFEVGHYRKDGSVLPLEVSVKPILWEGKEGFLSIGRDITERKQAEEDLRRSEASYRALAETIPDLLFKIDDQLRFVFIHAGRTEKLLVPEDEALFKTVYELLPPELAELTERNVKAVLDTGEIREYEYSLRMGESINYYEARMVPCTSNEVLALVRNITEQKRLMDELRWREEWFRGIYENNPMGIALVDPSTQRFLQVNGAFQSLLGYSQEELLTLTVKDVTHSEDWEREKSAISQRLVGATELFLLEKRYIRKDGDVRWVRITGETINDPHGKQLALATVVDLTERKKAEDALRQERERLEFVIDGSSLGTWEWNVQNNVTVFNDNWAEMLGYEIEDLIPYDYNTWTRLVHPEDVQHAELDLKNCLDGITKDYSSEFRMRSKSGEWIWILDRGRVMTWDDAGRPLLMYGTHTNITDIKKAMEALSESEQRHRDYITNTPYGVFVTDEKGRYLQVNPSACRITGYDESELLSLSIPDTLPEEGMEAGLAHFKQLVDTGKAHGELKFRHKSGEVRWWLVSAVKLSATRYLGFTNDITDRKQVEFALRESEEKYRALVMQSTDCMILHDLDGVILDINEHSCRTYGYTRDELLRMKVSDLDPDYVERADGRAFYDKMKPGEALVFEARQCSKDGHGFPVEVRLSLVEVGDRMLIQGLCRDITQRRLAEQALIESEERFRSITEQSSDFISLTDVQGIITYASPAARRIFGVEPEEMVGRHFIEFLDESSISKAMEGFQASVGEGKLARDIELLMKRGDGSRFFGELNGSLFGKGELQGTLVVIRDITERKNAEEEKARLMDQLQQAMKMEAVGRLAGGVAHDFNNLLTAITGNVQLSLMDISPGDPVEGALTEIAQAADSAASLTRQLLAFSRKQLIEPKVLNLNELIVSLEKMLRRLIGEDIELKTIPGKRLGSIKADPGQLEQILVNLAVNARDAMQDGGKLIVETANVELDDEYCRLHPHSRPGAYVGLAVSDTGTGMSDEVKSHLFEPFFTTKPKERGTGLGLATIYGAVKQSGGNVEVYSEEGEGTTFKIYLPLVSQKAERLQAAAPAIDMPGGDETVLIVEDEKSVRDMAIRILKRLGYNVLQAPDGGQAFMLAEKYTDKIDLLVTDVIIPGMNGRQLAERLIQIHPEMKVLYTSGYTENAIAHHGVIDEGLHFIGKPYTPQALAKKLRDVLER